MRSYDSANCSFDAVDFTVELNPFGAQVDEIIMRSSFGGFLKWGYPKLDGLKKGTILLKWMIWRSHFRKPPVCKTTTSLDLNFTQKLLSSLETPHCHFKNL